MPSGFDYEFYKPGDSIEWAIIHMKSGEFMSMEEGLKIFKDFYYSFIATTKNPYAFKVNGTLVKIRFLNNNRSEKDCINRILKNLYK